MADETVKIKIRNEDDDSEDDSVSGETAPASDGVNWQIEDRPMAHVNSEWLWALAIFSFSVIIFSVILKNYLLIVIVFLSAFIIYVSKNKKLELHSFQLTSEGLYIDGKFYNYENFESYWIFPDQLESQKEFSLRYKHRIMPLLTIPFHNKDENAIEKILEKRLPADEEEESFLDLLRKKLF